MTGGVGADPTRALDCWLAPTKTSTPMLENATFPPLTVTVVSFSAPMRTLYSVPRTAAVPAAVRISVGPLARTKISESAPKSRTTSGFPSLVGARICNCERSRIVIWVPLLNNNSARPPALVRSVSPKTSAPRSLASPQFFRLLFCSTRGRTPLRCATGSALAVPELHKSTSINKRRYLIKSS